MDKPTKPTNLLPESFGGEKENFDTNKIANGYEADVPDILGGANLNYLLDAAGKNLKYANTIVDYINDIPVNNSIITDANNKLKYTQYDCRVYKSTETYGLNEWVTGIVGEKKSIYQSLIAANTGNPLTDTTKWQKVELGGGTGLPLLSIRPAFYADESLGLDYYLNGQLLTVNANLQGAVNELKKLKAIRPSLFCTEEEWQAEKEASDHGQVGKFVLNETAGTLRLPAVINIQGVFDLQNTGLTVQAGLPNIVGDLMTNGNSFTAISGAFATRSQISNLSGGHSAATGYGNLTFDASHSNPIYGNNTTVQEEAIQYPCVIRLATGQETEVNIRNDIESLNPYTLFDAKYSEAKQYNASWVLGGSTLSKSVYPTAYEAALVEYNSEIADGTTVELPSGGSYTKRGVSGGITVKLSTDETATEYDWKLDTAAETFIAPTASRLASGKAVVGNGKGLGLTEGTNNMVLINYADTGANSYGANFSTAGYGLDVGASSAPSGAALNKVIGIVADPTKSGIELSGSNLYLYFLVASVAQNAPLANLGRIEETKVDKNSSWGFPSNRYIDLELGASGSTYTAPANGWYYLQKISGANNQHSSILALKDGETATEYMALGWTPMGNNGNVNMLKVPKGKKVEIHYNLTGATEIFRFIYAEGSN